MANVIYALSIKQPWAALMVHGHKSIEVRNWPTARRGRVLIHAARVPDPRPEGWKRLPMALQEAAKLCGGIIGVGELTDCRAYRNLDAFMADGAQHLNESEWFKPPVLFGFVFSRLSPCEFSPYSGWMRFFPVEMNSDAR